MHMRELMIVNNMPPMNNRLKPIAPLRLPNTGIKTEKVSVYRVIDQTAVDSEMLKCSINEVSAMETMLLPIVPINVPRSRAESVAQREDILDAGVVMSVVLFFYHRSAK